MPEPTDQELLHDAVRSTEQEIMDAAFAADPPADEPVDEQQDEGAQDQEQAEASDDRPRDEQGRFAKAKPDADKPQQEQPAQDQQGEQEQQQAGEDADVPRWRLREIAEERRQAQAERDQLRVELTRLQTQMSQMQRQPAQQQQQEQQIDPLLDPVAWQRKIESGFEEKLRTAVLNMDLRSAHRQHGETFEKAYTALLQEGQRGNGQLVRQLVGNPEGAGDRIVQWFKTNEMIRETKGDLQGYEKTLREKLLKDPEFIKAAMEAARGQANGGQQQQQGQRPNNITRLPPSLQRVPGGSQHTDPIDNDDSDKAVFDYAFRE